MSHATSHYPIFCFVRVATLLVYLCAASAYASVTDKPTRSVFDELNLALPQLSKTREALEAGDNQQAKIELLQYFKQRRTVIHPQINHWENQAVSLTPKEQKMADNGLKRLLFAHKGYEYFDYGPKINWHLWPVKDNEVRYQIHRMYWWLPMAKAYRKSGNEAYAKEWVFQFTDWMADNPSTQKRISDDPVTVTDDSTYDARYPWRSLEVSRRIQDQAAMFQYFLSSKHFSPVFLIQFLTNYHNHLIRLHSHYSAGKNHLLFQAQRMLMASILFPEFKQSQEWQDRAVTILHQELSKQIHPDGYQYEISPNYHVACIEIFLKAYHVAKLNGKQHLFSEHYLSRVNQMIHANMATSYPDLSVPMFGDAKWRSWEYMLSRYQYWATFYPQDEALQHFASGLTRYAPPRYLSKALLHTGLYSLRNGWDKTSTVLQMRNGIPGGQFHSQPDNGTFELWHNGSNLMPDSGAYIYAGDEAVMQKRRWFRQSKIHNTLTLDDKPIAVNATNRLWRTSPELDVAVIDNQSYPNLIHRRSLFFVNKQFFVILDEALGTATGKVRIRHFVKEGKTHFSEASHRLQTQFEGANLAIVALSAHPMKSQVEAGKVSYRYRQAKNRDGLTIEIDKANQNSVSAVSLLMPFDNEVGEVDVQLLEYHATTNRVNFSLSINGERYSLGYEIGN